MGEYRLQFCGNGMRRKTFQEFKNVVIPDNEISPDLQEKRYGFPGIFFLIQHRIVFWALVSLSGK